MEKTTLHELITAYKETGDGKARVMEGVADLVYGSFARFGFDDEDDAANALFRYGGRIERLVERFEDRGIPFDAYLATSLRYLARTVRRERRKGRDRELVCERAARLELEGSAEGPEGCRGFGEEPGPKPEEAVARARPGRRPRARGGTLRFGRSEAAAYSHRLIYLAVKCAWEIDDESIGRVAASAGADPEWLADAVEQARRSMAAERARIDRLVERRNASWCRMRMLEAKLGLEPDPGRRRALEISFAREAGRRERAERELRGVRTLVPNSVVARILGVPKGTVDSGLFYLRRHYGG
jgi:hypothetical protein